MLTLASAVLAFTALGIQRLAQALKIAPVGHENDSAANLGSLEKPGVTKPLSPVVKFPADPRRNSRHLRLRPAAIPC